MKTVRAMKDKIWGMISIISEVRWSQVLMNVCGTIHMLLFPYTFNVLITHIILGIDCHKLFKFNIGESHIDICKQHIQIIKTLYQVLY